MDIQKVKEIIYNTVFWYKVVKYPIKWVINQKKSNIQLYISQIKNINYDDRIIALNKYRGMIPEVDFAEAYQFVKNR